MLRPWTTNLTSASTSPSTRPSATPSTATAHAVATLAEHERTDRGKALTRWAKGFVARARRAPLRRGHASSSPACAIEVAVGERDHRRPRGRPPPPRRPPRPVAGDRPSARRLAPCPSATPEPKPSPSPSELHDLLASPPRRRGPGRAAAVLAALHRRRVRRGLPSRRSRRARRPGCGSSRPFSVDCYPTGPERDAFLASVPGVLRLLHRLVRPSYDRLTTAAFGPARTTALTPEKQ